MLKNDHQQKIKKKRTKRVCPINTLQEVKQDNSFSFSNNDINSFNASFETANVLFGNLKITVNSMISNNDEIMNKYIKPVQSNVFREDNDKPQVSTYKAQNFVNHVFRNQPKQQCVPIVHLCHPSIDLNTINNDNDDHLNKPDILCWWCKINKALSSYFVPLKYDDKRQRYIKMGFFCSWSCVKSYNMDMNDSQKQFRHSLILSLCKKLYGRQLSQRITYAPHWSKLIMFGGTMTNEEFNEKIISLKEEKC